MAKTKDKERKDKEWAKRYILDPLTAPEPSQLDGPGSSFFNPRRSLSLNKSKDTAPVLAHQRRHSSQPVAPIFASPPRPDFVIHHPKPISPGRRHSYLPLVERPPVDVILKRSQSLNPPSQRTHRTDRSQSLTLETQETRRPHLPNVDTSASQTKPQPIRRKPIAAPSETVAAPAQPTQLAQPARSAQPAKPSTKAAASSTKPPAPERDSTQLSRYPPRAGSKKLQKAPAAASPSSKSRVGRKPPQTHHTQGTAEILGDIILADKTSSYINRSPVSESASISKSSAAFSPIKQGRSSSSTGVSASTSTSTNTSISARTRTHSSTHPQPGSPPLRYPRLQRTGSFVRNPSGEMSYQAPVYASQPVAGPSHERHSSSSAHRKHRPRSNRPRPDTIDSLDLSGGVVYHHGGPYDATLAAVNANKKKSPLEAVKDSNKEALKATPPEYIQDSLTKHVPLQGTSIIPSGMPDRNGRVLYYKEGADLMREPDAAGGAYKRYDFILIEQKYLPEDLKGKGEPSYSLEKAEKAKMEAMKEAKKEAKRHKHSASYSHGQYNTYELQTQRHNSMPGDENTAVPVLVVPSEDLKEARSVLATGVPSRSQSFNDRSTSSRDTGLLDPDAGTGGRARSSSASHRFADGIRRRIGSLRRK